MQMAAEKESQNDDNDDSSDSDYEPPSDSEADNATESASARDDVIGGLSATVLELVRYDTIEEFNVDSKAEYTA